MDDNQCRVCLGEVEDVRYSVFKKVNGVAIEEQLKFVCTLQITEDDNFSKLLCKKCFNDTCTAYTFKTKCLDTDRTLKILEKKLNEKLLKISQNISVKQIFTQEQYEEAPKGVKQEYEEQEIEENEEIFGKEEIVFDEHSQEVFQAYVVDETEYQNDTEYKDETEYQTEENYDIPNDARYEEIEYLEPDLLEEQFEVFELKPKPTRKQNKISVSRGRTKNLDDHRIRRYNHQHRCKGCQNEFSTSQDLQTHLQSTECKENHEKPFKCYICQESFPMGITKKKHIQTEHQDKAGADCPLCLRCKIPSAIAYENHYKTHFAEPRFCCNYCARPFYESDRLQLHIKRAHEAVKFECNWCSKTFRDKSGITRHILGVHFNRRDHQCTLCPKAFTEGYNLKEHLFSVHKQASKFYSCDLCSLDFLYRKQFERHRKTCNGYPEKRKR